MTMGRRPLHNVRHRVCSHHAQLRTTAWRGSSLVLRSSRLTVPELDEPSDGDGTSDNCALQGRYSLGLAYYISWRRELGIQKAMIEAVNVSGVHPERGEKMGVDNDAR